VTDPIVELLLATADDDFVLGYRDSEWTGVAPMLEEDVAMSSISQDELGHARVLYELALQTMGQDPTDSRRLDALAYARPLDCYRCCRLVERHRGDWAFTIARRYLYETADDVRTEALAQSSLQPLANVIAKIRREERYHLLHLDVWFDRLASSDESRPRLLAALENVWPDALGFWESTCGEDDLIRSGVTAESSAALGERWLAEATSRFASLGIEPPQSAARTGGRQGERSPEFHELWAEATEVYRQDPDASW